MTESTKHRYRAATQAVREGQKRTAEQEHSEPIFATSSFVFDDCAQAAARFANEAPGNVYSRFTNPTVQAFEQRLAALEGGEACVATASGMSAIMATCLTALQAGDHIISSASIFGASRLLFGQFLAKFGVECTFVDLVDLDQWQDAIQANTKLAFFETPANPLTEIGDIKAIAGLLHNANSDIKVVVDNCFCTPILQQPLALGADVVIHSATKYIDGQGRCVGGAIVGDADFVGQKIYAYMRTAGPSLSPFNAWVFLKGLETLPLRIERSCDSAAALADWLAKQDAVTQVFYPGLTTHPQHDLAKSQQSKFGGIVSFEIEGGREAAWRLIDNTELLSITANLGDTRTTITHPYTTTHARWSDQEKQSSGINEGLIRISVGLEDVEDIIEDIRLT